MSNIDKLQSRSRQFASSFLDSYNIQKCNIKFTNENLMFYVLKRVCEILQDGPMGIVLLL